MKNLFRCLAFLIAAFSVAAQAPLLRTGWTTNANPTLARAALGLPFTNGASLLGVFYTNAATAIISATRNQTVTLLGTVTITNQVSITNGQIVDARNAIVLNSNTNFLGPLPFGFAITDGQWFGGIISNTLTPGYQVAIGFDSRAGHMASNRVYIEGLTIFGDSDCLFFYTTNIGSRVTLKNVRAFTGYDALVVASPDNMTEADGLYLSANHQGIDAASTLCALKICAGNHVFKNSTFNIIGTNASNILLVDPDATFHPTVSTTNVFNNCHFTGFPTNATKIQVGVNVMSGSLGETASVSLNNCVIDFDTAGCPAGAGVGVQNTGSSVYLFNTTVLPQSTNSQLDVSGSGTSKRAYLGPGNNVVSNRIAGASQNVRIVYSGGDVGTANSYVPNGWFTNLTGASLNVSGSATFTNGVTSLISNGLPLITVTSPWTNTYGRNCFLLNVSVSSTTTINGTTIGTAVAGLQTLGPIQNGEIVTFSGGTGFIKP